MPELDDRAGIEELVRQSLRQRSEDVEPTPALWAEVDRRVSRRRRWQAWSWSLAGVTAALTAIAIVPGLLDTGNGDGAVPEIAPLDRAPQPGVIPATALVGDDTGLAELDLETGELTRVGDPSAAAAGPLVQLEVRPGSAEDRYAALGVRHGLERPASLELVTAGDEDAQVTETLPAFEEHPEFTPSFAWAPDADLAVYTVPSDAGTQIMLWNTPTVGELADGAPAMLLAEVASDARLLDWIGADAAPGDESRLYVQQGDGSVVTLTVTVTDDGTLEAGDRNEPYDEMPVLDLASSHAVPDSTAEPIYLLREGDDGLELVWDAPADGMTTVSLGELPGVEVAAEDAGSWWLDAKQDAALVGRGGQVWLLAHDGAGEFVEPVLLDVRTARAALVDAVRPGGESAEGPEPTPDPAPQSPEVPQGEAEPGSGDVAVDLGDGLVVADGPNLVLVRPNGSSQTLYTFPTEGHSTIVGLSVRPGSTADDLTVALLTQAEGMYDVRWLRAIQGDTDGAHLFDAPEAQIATGVDLGSVPQPVWSPEGDLLAFVNALQGGGSELWVIGWDEEEPTEDPNRAVTQFALDTSEPLRAEAWIWTDEADGVARRGELLLSGVEADATYALPLERQADGAVALAADVEVEPRDWVLPGERQDGEIVEIPGPRSGVVQGDEVVPLEVPGVESVDAGDLIPRD